MRPESRSRLLPFGPWPLVLGLLFAPKIAAAQAPLVTLDHHVVSSRLRVEPEHLFVPKSIPGSLSIDIVSADGRAPDIAALGQGAHVEAVLRGPAFPATRVLGFPGEPLRLPPIPMAGDYQLDNVRLVDTASDRTLMEGSPSTIPVTVFPEVLVTQVDTRPLTIDEIVERGISIDSSNFSAVEFEAVFQIEGQSIPVRFPVVTPKHRYSTELIPTAEYEERLAEARRVNEDLVERLDLPDALVTAGLDVQIQGLNFERVLPPDDPATAQPTPIPAMVVIPGRVGFLNQFFSVQVFTANAAPIGSGVSVHGITAELTLPPGADTLPGTNDDPVVLARGESGVITPATMPITAPGADGALGTPDDRGRLGPGETGQTEFLVEGRRTGLHQLDLRLRATLSGFAHGEIEIEGVAAGAVLVRNPRFSLTFGHPLTVRANEPYVVSVTLMNTSETPANLVSVRLPAHGLSGARLAYPDQEVVNIGTLDPGESQTVTFDLVAERTGSIAFNNLVSGDGLSGRFDLRLAVDERGVALSPGVIGYPHWVDALPRGIRDAADRVLGRALAVSTAAVLPPGVRKVRRGIVEKRVLELAEAGQRLRYGDAPSSVLLDLLLDWHGGRYPSLGFDQILRETPAGDDLRAAVQASLPASTDVAGWIAGHRPALADRGEPWGVALAATPGVEPKITIDGLTSSAAGLALTESNHVGDASGSALLVARPTRGESAEVTFVVSPGAPSGTVSWASVGADGQGELRAWSIASDALAPRCYRLFPDRDPATVVVDVGCDGSEDGRSSTSATPIAPRPPSVLVVQQDLETLYTRPDPFCDGPTHSSNGRTFPYGNPGNLVAVLFSKPMDPDAVASGTFALDGAPPRRATLQASGRVALVGLATPIGTDRPRTLSVSGVADHQGSPLPSAAYPIVTFADDGVTVRGDVLSGSGAPIAGVPVTLTMLDRQATTAGCMLSERRISAVDTDAQGRFQFDFVPVGIGYRVSATDTRGLTSAARSALLELAPAGQLDPAEAQRVAESLGGSRALMEALEVESPTDAVAYVEGIDRAVFEDFVATTSPRVGSTVPVALRFRGRGRVFGRVFDADGITPVADAAVNLFPDQGSRELGRGLFSAADGSFAFEGVPIGPFSLTAETGDGRLSMQPGLLTTANEGLNVDLVLSSSPVLTGDLSGTVFEADGATPHPDAELMIVIPGRGALARARADAQGMFTFAGVPASAYVLTALSRDGRRAGSVSAQVLPGVTAYTQVRLPSTTSVRGRVRLENGRGLSGARVAGGSMIATTDANGYFDLVEVPIGRRGLTAAVPPTAANGLSFVRFGSKTLDVRPSTTNYAEIVVRPAGGIAGVVRDANNHRVPGVKVAIPVDQGFYWTQADDQGAYRFENLALASYTVVAPAPPVTDPSAAFDALAQGDMDRLASEIGQTIGAYASGFAREYLPSSYGFTTVELTRDGAMELGDIQYLPEVSASGVVLNDRDLPVGADVTLYGLKPMSNGRPRLQEIARSRSDPGTGVFGFTGLRQGPWRLEASSPFFDQDATAAGSTSRPPSPVTAILQFPANAQGGRIRGRVVLDAQSGAPAAGALVDIAFGVGITLTTDGNGDFLSPTLRAGAHLLRITHPATGRVAEQTVVVRGGEDANPVIPLLDYGDLVIRVLDAQGQPLAGADLTAQRLGSPALPPQVRQNVTGPQTLTQLIEGTYALEACYQPNQTRLCGRASATVSPGSSASATVRIAASGTLHGLYVQSDGRTVVQGAQISIGALAQATTDASGTFRVSGLPLGVHQLLGRDPATGRSASATGRLDNDGEVKQVVLREETLGEVVGHVISADGQSFEPGAEVVLSPSHPLYSDLRAISAPDGSFRFPGIPPGAFRLSARATGTLQSSGLAQGNMPNTGGTVSLDVALARLATLIVDVLEADGSPASGAFVDLGGASVNADAAGRVTWPGLGLGSHRVSARSSRPGESRSFAERSVVLTSAGASAPVVLSLSGVGTVEVTVSDGANPSAGAAVTLWTDAPAFSARLIGVQATDAQGVATFTNVPPGTATAHAQLGATGGAGSTVVNAGPTPNPLTIALTPVRDLQARLLREDQVTPLAGQEVELGFTRPLGGAVSFTTTTAVDGSFGFSGVPLGAATLRARAPAYDGVLFAAVSVTSGPGPQDLGALYLDEARPWVSSTVPLDNDTSVPVDQPLRIRFSEAMDPASLDPAAILLDPPAPVSLSWATNGGVTDELVVTPSSPLASETAYTLTVIAGALRSVTGAVLAMGPTDLAGRDLVQDAQLSFVTRDATPPQLVSLSPAPSAVQVPVGAVVRAVFSEPIDPSAQVRLTDSTGTLVSGQTALGLGNTLLVFDPVPDLRPNETYTVELQGITDAAGNGLVDALGNPTPSLQVDFQTLDTLGPALSDLRVIAGPLVENATGVFEGVLTTPEPGAQVRVLRGPQEYLSGVSSSTVAVPNLAAGSLTLLANAIDRFGNHGPSQLFTFNVQANLPPTVSIAQVEPASGPLLTGRPYRLTVIGQDDDQVQQIAAQLSGAITASSTVPGGALVLAGTVPDVGPSAGSVQAFARAFDSSGATGTATASLPVADGLDPVVAVSPSATTELVLDPGSTTFVVDASDAYGVASVRLTVEGDFSAADTALVSPPAPTITRNLTIQVPPTPGAVANLELRVDDASGRSTLESFDLRVRDTIPPTVSAALPADGATGVPHQSTILVTFSEPVVGVGAGSFFLADASGSVVPTSLSVALNRTNATLVPLAPLAPSATYDVHVTSAVMDDAGLALAPFTSSFTTAPAAQAGPQLVAIRPAAGTAGVPLMPVIEIEFDAPIDPASTLGAVTLTDSSGAIVATNLNTSPPGFLRYTPAAPLLIGETYDVSILGALTGGGLQVRDETGANFTQRTTDFTTRDVTIAVPPVDRAVGGYGATAQVSLQSVTPVGSNIGAQLQRIEWTIVGTQLSATRTFGSSLRDLDFTFTAPTGAANLTIEALATFENIPGQHTVSALSLPIEPPNADFDGDGLSNAQELGAGLDPWTSDATQDPDNDLLDNAGEIAAATDPFDPDSDGDGVLDGVDPEPTDATRAPVAGMRLSNSGAQFSSGGTLQLPSTTRLAPPFTLEFTVQPPTTSGPIFDSGSADALRVDYDAAQRSFSASITDAGGNVLSLSSPPGSATVDWRHVAVVHDGTRARLYVDGLAVGQGLIGAPAFASNEQAVMTCHRIDEVRLWTTARTTQALQQHAWRQVDPGEPGLEALWRFDDASDLGVESTGRHGAAMLVNAYSGSGPDRYGDRYDAVPPTGVDITLEGADPFDGSLPLTWQVTHVPATGQLYEINSSGNVLRPLSTSTTGPTRIDLGAWHTVRFIPNPSGFGVHTLRYRVQDSTGRVSSEARLDLDLVPPKTWVGADATRPTDWTAASNWSPAGAPIATDDVVIDPVSPTTITLAADVHVRSLQLGPGHTLDLAGHQLVANGSVESFGSILNGTTQLELASGRTGPQVALRGSFDQLDIERPAALSGPVHVASSLHVTRPYGAIVGGGVHVGSHWLSVGGDLDCESPLSMDDPNGVVDVEGDVTFQLAGTAQLTAGTLHIAGDLSVPVSTGLRAGGTHRLELDGVGLQVINLIYSRATDSLASHLYNQLQDLTISNVSAAGVRFDSDVVVAGTLTIVPGATVRTAAGVRAATLNLGANATIEGTAGAGSAAALVVVEGAATTGSQSRLVATSLELGAGTQLDATGTLTAQRLVLGEALGTLPSGTQPQQLVLAADGVVPSGVPLVDLEVRADVQAGGPTTIAGDLTVASGSFDPSGSSVSVGGDLHVGSGEYVSTSPTSVLSVSGDATFGSPGSNCTTTSQPTAGLLRIRGNVSITTNHCLRASPGHRTELDPASGPAFLSVRGGINNLPGPGQSPNNHFGDLALVAGTIITDSNVAVAGDFTSAARFEGPELPLRVGGDATLDGLSNLAGLEVQGTLHHNTSNLLRVFGRADIERFGTNAGPASFDTLALTGAGSLPGGITARVLEVQGALALSTDTDPGANSALVVASGGSLDLAGRHLRVDSAQFSGALVMNAGRLDVDGNLDFASSCAPASVSDGTIEVSGDLGITCQNAYRPGPAHSLVFDGPLTPTAPDPQVSLHGSNSFTNVTVADGSRVTFANAARIDGTLTIGLGAQVTTTPNEALVVDGGLDVASGALLDAESLDLGVDATGAGTITTTNLTLGRNVTAIPGFVGSSTHLRIERALTLAADLTVADLTIARDTAVPGDASLDVSTRTLIVSGDLAVAGRGATLDMTLPGATVQVLGAATFGTSGCTSSARTSRLEQGVLTVVGDFDQVNFCASDTFVASASHTTVFAGNGQTVRFVTPSPGASGLQNVIVSGPNVTFTTSARIEGDADVSGQLTVNGSHTLTIQGALDVSGTLNNLGTVTAASCTLSGSGSTTGNPTQPVCQ